MANLITQLRVSGVIKKLIPPQLRSAVYMLFKDVLDRRLWQAEHDRIVASAHHAGAVSGISGRKVGLIWDRMLRHSFYEAACIELGINYEIVNPYEPGWESRVERSDRVVWFVRPFVQTAEGKRFYDEIAARIDRMPGKRLYPSLLELQLFESKIRQAEWLQKNGISAPKAWIFRTRDDAMNFARTAELPVVFKTDMGAEALGVRIVRQREAVLQLVCQCFSKGFHLPRTREAQKDVVMFQEFVPEAREWRVTCIGGSWFAHRKGRIGDFHSGSKIIEYENPPVELLEYCRDIVEKGKFRAIAIDVLESVDKKYMAIELQTYFGCNRPHMMEIDGKRGRYLHGDGIWKFEEGDFNRNNSCNLRIQDGLANGL